MSEVFEVTERKCYAAIGIILIKSNSNQNLNTIISHQETYPFNPLFGVVSPAVGDTPHKKGVTQAPLHGTFIIPNSKKVAREKKK